MPAECCFKISAPRLSFAEATLAEPLAIGIYAVKTSIPLSKASRIAILGAGPIGLSVLAAAKAAGAGPVHVTDKITARLWMAKKMGAAWTGNPRGSDVVKAILRRSPRGMDVVFECCGQQDALDQGIELLKPGGKLMVVGIPEVERVSFSADKIRRREICIQNVRRQAHCTQAALSMIEKKPGCVRPMITHVFPFSETRRAFDLVAGYRDGVVKAAIVFE